MQLIAKLSPLGDSKFTSDDGVKNDTFIKVAGKYAEGLYATGPIDTSKFPLAVEAIEKHKKQYGADPGAFYLNAYAATEALLNAIDMAGSTDYDAVSAALRNEWVETPLGKISFDASTPRVMPRAPDSPCMWSRTGNTK